MIRLMTLYRSLTIIGILLTVNLAPGAVEPTVLPVNYGQFAGAVAVGPENTLVAWSDYRRTEDLAHEVFGTRIGPLGETLDGDGIPLTGPVTGGPALTALGDQFLIVWAKGPQVFARRMTSAGQLLDAQPITVTSGQSNHPYPDNINLFLTAASDGKNFWVAWIDYRSIPLGTPEHLVYGYQDVYAARISSAGQVLDRNGIRICAGRGMQEAPKLSPRADFITWMDYRTPGQRALFGARLHPRGLCLDPAGFGIVRSTNSFSPPDVSVNANGWMVVWGEPNRIRAACVSRQKVVSPPFVVARTAHETWPQVASVGLGHAIFWQSGSDTVGVRVNGKQPGQPFTLASEASGAAALSIADVAVSGGNYCVIGTRLPQGSSWFYNDVWFAPFSRAAIP